MQNSNKDHSNSPNAADDLLQQLSKCHLLDGLGANDILRNTDGSISFKVPQFKPGQKPTTIIITPSIGGNGLTLKGLRYSSLRNALTCTPFFEARNVLTRDLRKVIQGAIETE